MPKSAFPPSVGTPARTRLDQQQRNRSASPRLTHAPAADAAPGADTLDRLFPIVFGDPTLRDRLLAEHDRAHFGRLLSEVAKTHDIALSAEEVEALLNDARRRWLERRL